MHASPVAGMQGASALWRCGRRSSPPAPWPWTRWTCAADPSTSGAPRDTWSRLRWGSVSSALISLLGKMLLRRLCSRLGSVQCPRDTLAMALARAELAAGVFKWTRVSAY